MKKLLLVLIVSFLAVFSYKTTYATHVAGGEITYVHLGNDSFEITLTLYRDCSGIPMGTNKSITISSSCTGSSTLPLTLQNVGGTEVSQICPAQINQSECNGGTLPGMQKYEFKAITQLSTHCSDYQFSFSECCRNSAVNSIGQQNYFIDATLNSVLYPNNSSPEYTAPPIPYVCVNQPVNYNYGVVENDGDSITYALVNARTSSTNSINYASGYSGAVPIVGITIDSQTGQLTFTPTLTGHFIIACEVTEYNGAGQIISTVERDIQFVVISCSNTIPAAPTAASNLVNNAGSAAFTDSLEITASPGDDFCFDISFSDPNPTDVVYLTSNVTSALPGATITTAGTNPLVATVCWNVPQGMNAINTITFQSSDSACPVSGVNSVAMNILVNQPNDLTGALVTTPISCAGACDGTGTVTPSGGVGPYSYFWYSPSTNTWCCNGLSSISGMCAGTYILIVTDLGDPDPSTNTWDTTFLMQDPAPMVLIPGVHVDDDCTPTCVGQQQVIAFGGNSPYSYLWDNGTTGNTNTGLCAGVTTVTVTDANNCTVTESYEIFEPTMPTVAIDSIDSVTCFGGNDGVVYASATPTCGVATASCPTNSTAFIGMGTATNTSTTYPAIYGNNQMGAKHQLLFTAAELNAQGITGGIIDQIGFENTAIGGTSNFANFTIKLGCTSVSDLTGGWETGLIEVFSPKTVTATIGWQTHNFDVNYYWDGVSNVVVEVCFNNPSIGFNGNVSTKYTPTTNQSVLYYADNNMGVCASNSMTATSQNRPNIRFSYCTSTITYAWSPAPATGQTTPTASNLTAQTYTVSATLDGCTITETATVEEPTELDPVITLDAPVSCPGQCDAQISVATTGGIAPYTYAWSGGLGTGTSHSNLCAGTYTVTVTDANNCTMTESITVVDPTPIVVSHTIDQGISCNGVCDGQVTVSASGGTAPLTIAWPGGNTGATQTNLCAGTFVVTITDAGGCFTTETVTLTEPAPLATSLTATGTILCFGDNTVSITSATTGGTTAYSYLWSNGATTADILNVGVGTYTLTVTDANGCTATDNVTITGPTQLTGNITQTGFILCNGDLTGALSVAASGGTPAYSYLWSTGGTGTSISNLPAGGYSVVITDANGCDTTLSFTITQPLPISANPTTVTPISCNGVCDGSVSIAPSGGTAPYTVVWPTGVTVVGNTASGLCGATNYVVTITDANSCVINETINLTEPGVLAVSIVETQAISCGGTCDGILTANVTGGTAPYSYAWSNGQTTNPQSNLCDGSYSVTITDANSCTATGSFTLTEPTPLTGTLTQTGTILCFGDSTVNLSATAAGGTAPYSFSWSNGGTGPTQNSVGAGNYTVTITDASGCTFTANTTVNGPTAITANFVVDQAISCNGVCDGQVTVTASGGTPGYTFDWPSGATGATQTALCAGTYNVTVTDANNCTEIVPVVITEPAAIVMTSSITTPISCNGVCDASATVSTTGGSAPITIAWPGGLTGGTQNNLCAGTYTVTATDANGCTNTTDVIITEPAVLTLTIADTGSILCFGDSTVGINSTVTGGTTAYGYLWSNGATTANLTNVGAGIYGLTVTDANGCQDSASVTITEPNQLTASISQTATIACNGDSTAALDVTVNGGTLPYNYAWSNGGTGSTISNLPAGNYSVTITDGNGCTEIDNFTVTEPAAMTTTQTISAAVSCFGACDGQVYVQASGGAVPYTYVWPTGVTITNDTATNLCGNTDYVVTVTDANGCSVLDTVNITEPTEINTSINIDAAVTCGGSCNGQVTASSTNGVAPYTYAWSNGLSGSTINNLCAGQYIVTTSDANGCSTIDTIVLTQPGTITASISTTGTILCFGDSTVDLTVSASGGTAPLTYAWSTGSTATTLSNMPAGTYTVTVTDANGCFITETETVSGPTQLVLNYNITQGISCSGQCDASVTLLASGGTPGVSFLWPDGSTLSSRTNMCAGNYLVTVTDANGCTDTTTIVIADPGSITFTSVIDQSISCNGVCDGQITLTPNGGTSPYTISWANGATGATAGSLCVGQQVFTITDASGCFITDSVLLTEPTALVLGLTQTASNLCFGDCDAAASSTVTGGTAPYIVVWPGNDTINNKTNLCAGNYIVTVTDANGCTDTETITIAEPTDLVATITVNTTISCNGVCDGDITVATTGGTAPYSLVWEDGSTGNNRANLCAGTFSVTVTDANGCQDSTDVVLTEPTAILAVESITGATCGLCDGGISLTSVTGGTSPYTFAWSNGINTQNITNLCPGQYTVTITDASGCTQNFTYNVSNTSGPTGASFVQVSPSCNGTCDGELEVIPTGGSAPFTYAWSNGGNTASITNLCADTFTVTITDASGCILIVTDTLTEPDVISNTASIVNTTCGGNCDGEISLTTTGGAGGYTYAWSSGGSGSTESNLCAGTYYVTTSDASGCSVIDTFDITAPGSINISVSTVDALCSTSCDGSATATISGGTAPYSIIWSTGGTGTTENGICPGTGTVTVIDAAGCSETETFNIGSPTAIVISSVVVTDATCGQADGGAVATASGGVAPLTYTWNGSVTGNTLSNVTAGVYTLVVSDANGCSVTMNVPINNITSPSITLTGNDLTCFGDNNGSATVTVSGGGVNSILWNTGSSNNTISGLSGGQYWVQVTDLTSGCIATDTITINEPSQITINNVIVTDATCGQSNGGALAFATGGTGNLTYIWNSTQGNPLVNVPGGSYNLQVIDDNGCDVSTIVPINDITGPVAVASGTNALCSNDSSGSVSVTVTPATGTYTYLWSNGQTTPTVNNLPAGIYSVVVTDAVSGCIGVDTFTILAPSPMNIDNVVVVDPTCGQSDGSIDVTVSGGTPNYTYTWNGANLGNPATGIPSGIYQLVVTDANGCTIDQNIPVSDGGAHTIQTSTTSVPCSGDCIGTAIATVSGGTGPFGYVWSNGDVGPFADSLCAGQVGVLVVDSANGCTSTDTATVIQIQGLQLTLTATTNTNCNGVCDGSVLATVAGASGQLTYAWSTGDTGAIILNACAGTYAVTVSDASGCSAIDSIQVTEIPGLVVALDSMYQTTCSYSNDGAIDINVSGGALPYTFAWTGPGGFSDTTQNISGILPGAYAVTVSDANGCAIQDTFQVTSESNLEVTLADEVFCSDTQTIVLQPVVTGATDTLVYQWYNLIGGVLGNDSVLQVEPSADTMYYVVSVVSGRCGAVDTAYVAPGQIPDVDAGLDQEITVGQTAELGGNPTTSWGGSTFAWTPDESLNNATSANPTASPEVTTTYQVEVTNILGCSNTDTVRITVNDGFLVYSGFTPNGDGDNDVWNLPFISEFPSASVKVYNRWGEMIFESEAGYPTPWDGKHEGADVPVGTYYYVIELNDGAFPEPISGPITIMR